MSDACMLASCNKATTGALVTCSLLCCQAADMPLLAAGPGVLPTAAAAATPLTQCGVSRCFRQGAMVPVATCPMQAGDV